MDVFNIKWYQFIMKYQRNKARKLARVAAAEREEMLRKRMSEKK